MLSQTLRYLLTTLSFVLKPLGSPERVFLLLLTAMVLIVLWSYEHTQDRDGASLLKDAPVLAPITNLNDLSEIVIATRLGPTTYLTDPDGKTVGLEHDLGISFGAYLGKPVRFLVLDNLDQVLTAVKLHKAHFAAAAVHETSELKQQFDFTLAYQNSHPVIVYNNNFNSPINSPQDMIGKKVGVVPDPTHLEILKQYKEKFPKLSWLSYPRGDIDLDLLQKVYEGTVDFAISDSNTVAIAQHYYPDLVVAQHLTPSSPLAWAFPKDSNNPLFQAASVFFKRWDHGGDLSEVVERYYGHINALDREDSSVFMVKRASRLPKFTQIFKKAQSLTNIDWRLLAAVAYQESRWDNNALSPTGVRGLMMLTADTADHLHVSNRLDPNESVPAAAIYLKQLEESIPRSVPEPDRLWMALAAYNVGIAHLEDARKIAQHKGMNPNAWNDIKKILPLLSVPAVFSKTEYGFARGGEPVNYVENIRSYYDILSRFEDKYRPGLKFLDFTNR
ncbi:MAG: lytic transglycosylase F [Ferrovum sp. 37-45-19]|uniref:membrane-bound lytic murein transglycosylase MltF n=1 Tax=Ferrovum sp. JA12 TaxID=1356299 RepID=UPI00070398D5|nr:membrane-bound lytic murein transglycosylase MltF [Ferrovum sp. JA12]OYV80194.1 MAG: lytic transglycosylase F [Ferrovum sp. 21-44-67]OYV94471.1 MAG: lytic transglycosylase F [Ferrovum sp. 37-45-19]OZB32453.1 MAG: lytic transglycosylase F [Ferrovum sp. 34-44-207]HQT81631.1 membrane-bound lytic murein transglycosylase MltF [Ferrovaceae bacterium]KRH78874.1 membrane-bound lytic murein transglycosylase F precursor [Ferrovum sp. JA12]